MLILYLNLIIFYIELFNVACHEAKSEFKQLIFFEQIQRFQLEKKYKSEDEKYLKDKGIKLFNIKFL